MKLLNRASFVKKNFYNEENLFSFLTLFFTLTTLLLAFWRLHYGVDLTDEAWFVGVAYRFAQGARPFVEELLYNQTLAFFTFPLIKIYLLINRGPEGMILFSRYAYFVFTFLIWLFSFNVFKKFFDWRVSMLIPLIFFLYAPCNLYNFSHHTLGMGFLSLSLFLGFLFTLNKKPLFLTFSGFLGVLASVAYPTLAFIFILMPFIFLFLARRISNLAYYCFGSAIGMGFFLPFFLPLENVRVSIAYTGSTKVGTTTFELSRLIKVFTSLWNSYPYKTIVITLLLIILYLWKYKKVEVRYLLFVIPFLPLGSQGFNIHPCTVSLGYVFSTSLLAPYLFLFTPRDEQSRSVLILVWLPSFIAGIVTAYTSGSGYLKAGVGSLPACVVTFFLLVKALESSRIVSSIRKLLILIVLITLLTLFLFFQFTGFYREDEWRKLNSKADRGIFRGIYTTDAKIDYLEQLEKDLKKVSKGAKTIFFYDKFPVGYFLTDLKPLANTMWVYPKFSNLDLREDLVIDYFRKGRRNPDVVVRVKRIFFTIEHPYYIYYPSNHALNNYFVKEKKYRLVISKRDYDIFRRPLRSF